MIPWDLIVPFASVAVGAGGVAGWLKGRREAGKLSRESDQLAQTIYKDALEMGKANYAEANARLAEQDARLGAQELRIDVLSLHLSRAEQEAVHMHLWKRNGAPPPPPGEPAWVADRLDRFEGLVKDNG